ncbi:hypothetical protein KAJ27_05885 [bacterium]|nr:hypothetical protein [bacterium]
MYRIFQSIFFLFLIIAFSNALFCGSLFVGEKVIYGGGPDTPPQEKDIGVKLNADVKNVGTPSGAVVDKNFKSAMVSLEENDLQKAVAYFDMSMDVNKTGTKTYRKSLLFWAETKRKMKDFSEAIERLEEYQNGLLKKDFAITKLIKELKKEL